MLRAVIGAFKIKGWVKKIPAVGIPHCPPNGVWQSIFLPHRVTDFRLAAVTPTEPRHSNVIKETKVVIIGGGIVGCSVAYHLAKLGWKDVVLLEQNQLAGGTTWHAAGLVGRLRTTNSMTKINKYSAELYAGLERETGHSVGWKQVGSLILARSQDRLTQLRRTAAMSEWFD